MANPVKMKVLAVTPKQANQIAKQVLKAHGQLIKAETVARQSGDRSLIDATTQAREGIGDALDLWARRNGIDLKAL